MTEHTVEISVKGRWAKVPALAINGNNVIVMGRWIKVAVIHNEQWVDIQLDDPEPWVRKRGRFRRLD
jgi:hypothetical protein